MPAPAEKATQLADTRRRPGLVVANDENLGRLSALRVNAERLGVTSRRSRTGRRPVHPRRLRVEDSTRPRRRAVFLRGNHPEEPRRPRRAGKATGENLAGTAEIDILRRAVRRPKGRNVVYSTCTFAPEENEAVVDGCSNRGRLQVVAFEWASKRGPGITEWDGEDVRRLARRDEDGSIPTGTTPAASSPRNWRSPDEWPERERQGRLRAPARHGRRTGSRGPSDPRGSRGLVDRALRRPARRFDDYSSGRRARGRLGVRRGRPQGPARSRHWG